MSRDFLVKYKEYKDKIYAYFWYRLDFDRAVSEDLAQQVFLKAFDKFDGFSAEWSFRSWIYSIAQDKLRDYYRGLGRYYNPSDYRRELLNNLSLQVNDEMGWEQVLYLVRSLPTAYSEVMILYFIDGLDDKDIAELMGIDQMLVREHISQVLKVIMRSEEELGSLELRLKNLPTPKLSQHSDRMIKVKLISRVARKEMGSFTFVYLRQKKVVVTASVLLLMLLSALAPSYAYASREVTPGHFLYGLKTAMEKVEYDVSKDKSETLLKFSLRRMQEAEVLADKGDRDKDVAVLMNEVIKYKAQALNTPEATDLLSVERYKQQGFEVLKQVARKVGIESADEVIDAVAITIEEVRRVSEAKQKKDENVEVDIGTDDGESENKHEQDEEQYDDVVEGSKERNEKSEKQDEDESGSVEEKEDEGGGIEESQEKDHQNEEKPIDKKEDAFENNSNEKDDTPNNDNEPKVGDEKKNIEAEVNEGKNDQTSNKREDEINKLKENVKKLEGELKEENYDMEQVEKLMKKINSKIEKAEKEKDEKKSEEIMKPAKALTNNAKLFVEKSEGVNNKGDNTKSEIDKSPKDDKVSDPDKKDQSNDSDPIKNEDDLDEDKATTTDKSKVAPGSKDREMPENANNDK